eukprot:2861956-Lingulodinium_polyedra.AAC.1
MATDRIHYYAPVHETGHVGTDLDWPTLRDDAQEATMRARANGPAQAAPRPTEAQTVRTYGGHVWQWSGS